MLSPPSTKYTKTACQIARTTDSCWSASGRADFPPTPSVVYHSPTYGYPDLMRIARSERKRTPNALKPAKAVSVPADSMVRSCPLPIPQPPGRLATELCGRVADVQAEGGF
eukprot:CAMPEP_0182610654 /NCGR_PEP_ID=MMETSP1330-20130603/9409_1 /TAXON_ID=464278 /ORGANISM="Picochlorum sp., Strain RCC944" /LENGTH=110 /DNA_ID=CAMNT_0024829885 /DNA_START=83 /DNA_END=415 /DNA_ORIENTATION=-